jgi:hypothetical protein
MAGGASQPPLLGYVADELGIGFALCAPEAMVEVSDVEGVWCVTTPQLAEEVQEHERVCAS